MWKEACEPLCSLESWFLLGLNVKALCGESWTLRNKRKPSCSLPYIPRPTTFQQTTTISIQQDGQNSTGSRGIAGCARHLQRLSCPRSQTKVSEALHCLYIGKLQSSHMTPATSTKSSSNPASPPSSSSSRHGAGTARTWPRSTRNWRPTSSSPKTKSQSPKSTPMPRRTWVGDSACRASRR